MDQPTPIEPTVQAGSRVGTVPGEAPAPGSDRFVRMLAAAALAVLLAMTARVGADTRAAVGRPWWGFAMHATGVVSVSAVDAPQLKERLAGLQPQDRIVTLDGRPMASGLDVRRAVESAPAGTLFRYGVERPDGTRFELDLPSVPFDRSYVRSSWLPLMLAGLALLLVSSIAVFARPSLTPARLLFLSTLGLVANYSLLTWDFFAGWRFTPWQRCGGFLTMATLLHLGLCFPERRWPLASSARPTLAVLYGGAAAFTLAFAGSSLASPHPAFAFDYLEFAGLATAAATLMANIVLSAFSSTDAHGRRQALVALAGVVAIAMASALLIVDSFHLLPFAVPPLVYPTPLLLGAVLVAYAVVKQNIFEFDAIVRRGLGFAAVATMALLAYGAALLAMQALFGATTAWFASLLPAVVPLLLLPGAPRLRRFVDDTIEQLLFPGQRRAREAVRDAAHRLIRLRDSEELVRYLRDLLGECFAAGSVRVVAGEPGAELQEIAPSTPGDAAALAAGDPLHAEIRAGKLVVLEGPAAKAPSSPWARRCSAALVVSFPASERLVGALVLGPRSDRRLYVADDHVMLATLAGHVGAALENARAWDEVRRLESRLTAEAVYLRQELAEETGAGDIIGNSLPLRAAMTRVKQVAPTDAGVLVSGETGCGKELVVRAIHAQSRRADRPLVKIACAALPEALLESELFGHERGAFTGAVSRKLGRFEVADGGTIFFDDVDALPAAVQPKLLRALQEGEVQRLGDNTVRKVDVRVIAATNRDLLDEVRAGRFREDLYYRLNVVPIHLPPLRERPDDLQALVEHFVRVEGPRLGRSVHAISSEAMSALRAYSWPGNVRELRNVIERALVLGQGEVLTLPGPLSGPSSPASGGLPEPGSAPLAELLREYKTTLILRALEASQGNQRVAAEMLGLHRPSLTRMIKELGIPVART